MASAVIPAPVQDAVARVAVLLGDRPRLRIFLFGSRSKGTTDPRADFDIAIDVGEPLAPAILDRLREVFELLPILQRVDVVDFATADPSFRRVAEQSTVLLYEREATSAGREP